MMLLVVQIIRQFVILNFHSLTEKILQKEIKIGNNSFPVFNNFLLLLINPH
jgi:hypothetical protein